MFIDETGNYQSLQNSKTVNMFCLFFCHIAHNTGKVNPGVVVGAIMGVLVGVILVIAVAIGVAIYIRKKRDEDEQKQL